MTVYGKYHHVQFIGLTRPMLLWWYAHAKALQHDSFERWAYFLGGSGGKKEDPDTPYYLQKGAHVSEKEAAELIANPLRDFPHDVKYLTPKDVNNKKKHSEMMLARRHPDSIPQEVKDAAWDETRVAAANGKHGIVAKRAAQNDILWLWFKSMQEAGVTVTLELLKQRVQIDVTRSMLYPRPDYVNQKNREILERMIDVDPGEKKGDKPVVKVLHRKAPEYVKPNYESPHPPEWFLKELEERGEVSDIAARLEALGKGEL